MYSIYILKCQDKTLYTGITTNLERRLKQHNDGVASKYTRSRRPVVLLYLEQAKNRSIATKRELQIKKLSRAQKLELIKESSEPLL